MAREATVLIVPGLRGHVPQHWQTLLASRLPRVRMIEPMGREDLDCARRMAAIEREANAIKGPLLLVAHSGGVIMVVHWAKRTQRAVHGALLATPPDFQRAMPAGYPTIDELQAGGWLPVPRDRLPFSTIVTASRNDPLGHFERVAGLARDWGSKLVDLGEVGHLNPASGYGDWVGADSLIAELTEARASDHNPAFAIRG
jgi:hypothetical protein